MAQKITAVEWIFDQYVKHNGEISESLLRKAFAKEREQMSEVYSEGYKRCSYIKSLMDVTFNPNDEDTPEDFDTYYEKTYGE